LSGAAGVILAEIGQAPTVVANQLGALEEPLRELAARLRKNPPRVAVTCARGSSAHAATFGKHLIERYLGIPVVAAAPNIASVYGLQLHLKDQFFLAISQSGRSDDLVEMTAAAKKSGALTAAIVNDTASPLASCSDVILPMGAGPEMSIAATKSFVATLAALLRLAAAWTGEAGLETALQRLPERLALAGDCDWSAATSTLAGETSLITVGRGPTLAIAREAALKLKETSNLHAEAFSSAEFLHGPVALVSSHYPILMFIPGDAAAQSMHQLVQSLREKGARLFTTMPGTPAPGVLPALEPDHPEADAVCLIQSFYMMAVKLAASRGMDAGNPRHLSKVTRTR
jgi:glutamine---fructose-6-phosphate transaminase (isomerizing)